MSQNNSKIRAAKEADKASGEAREKRSGLIESEAKNSPIWQANQVLQDVGKEVVVAGEDLAANRKLVHSLEAQLATARKSTVTLTQDWDDAYNVYVSTAEALATKPEDLTALALTVLEKSTHVLVPPLGVDVKFDAKANLIRIVVKRPPGEHKCRIEISPDPVAPGSFKEIKGNGARRALAGYTPGGYWIRAAMIDAGDQSDFSPPVFVQVK